MGTVKDAAGDREVQLSSASLLLPSFFFFFPTSLAQ